jgi:predicted transposase YdaD
MAKPADVSTKILISLAPDNWVRWVTNIPVETVLAFFATFVLESALVQEIMRWDMAVLRESPWYQEILREGEARGLLSGIELALEIKFGNSGLELMPLINQITDLSKLKAIQQAIKTVNSAEEFRQLF